MTNGLSRGPGDMDLPPVTYVLRMFCVAETNNDLGTFEDVFSLLPIPCHVLAAADVLIPLACLCAFSDDWNYLRLTL